MQIGSLNIPVWAAVVLMIAGWVFICTIVVLIGVTIRDNIDDWVEHKKYEHKRKHRFDKPPIAKCYCKDCIHFGGSIYDNACSCHKGWQVADNWFCWAAEPRSTDPDEEDNK